MTDLEQWRQEHSMAVNYRCECGGPVRHYDSSSDDETKLKCFECGTIGTIHHGLIRRKLDGLQRI
jgi:hypothetical protein